MINAVKTVEMPPSQKLILFILADCHNDETGRCDPSGAYLMKVSGYSNRTVWTAVQELVKSGHLTVLESTSKARNSYLIHPKTSEATSQPKAKKQCNPYTNQCNSFTSETTSHVKLLHKSSEILAQSSEILARTSEATSHKTEEPIEPERTGTKRLAVTNSDFQKACNVTLGLLADDLLKRGWEEWQSYRQTRHRAKGKAHALWTLQSARLSADQIERYAEEFGAQMVYDRIIAAISGGWQGLNLDKLEHPRPAKAGGFNSYTSPQASRERAIQTTPMENTAESALGPMVEKMRRDMEITVAKVNGTYVPTPEDLEPFEFIEDSRDD